jgi:heme-degrading monooxygenase HmoA
MNLHRARQFSVAMRNHRHSPGSTEENTVFIAMNRFKVKSGSEEAFEKVWLGRETYIDGVPGFVEFHLLKGPDAESYTLYSSHTVWESKAAFQAWTTSEEFRKAHARAGNDTTGSLYLEHPKFEGFEVRQTVRRREATVA